MILGPVFIREVRRGTRSPAAWGLALGLCWLGQAWVDPLAAAISICALACGFTLWSAFRVVATELDDETLELLALTPLTLPSILVEIAIAHAVRGIAVAAPALCVIALRSDAPTHEALLGVSIEGAAITLAAAGYGAMGALRIDERGKAKAMWVGSAILVAMILGLGWFAQRPLVDAVPGLLATGVAGTFLLYGLWRWEGGMWPESVGRPPAVPSGDGETEVCHTRMDRVAGRAASDASLKWGRATPDSVSPILWRELSMGAAIRGLGTLGLIAAGMLGLGVARMVFLGELHGHLRPALETGCGALLIAELAASCVIAALVAARASRDRIQGLADEILATPISAREYSLGLACGAMIQVMCLLAPSLILGTYVLWLATAAFLPVGEGVLLLNGMSPLHGPGVLALLVLTPVITWPMGAVAGSVAGRAADRRLTAMVIAIVLLAAVPVLLAVAMQLAGDMVFVGSPVHL